MGNNPSASTAQLRSLRVLLSVSAYSKFDFGVADLAMAFLKSKPLDGGIYLAPSLLAGTVSNTRWKLKKPLYRPPTSYKARYCLWEIPRYRVNGRIDSVR